MAEPAPWALVLLDHGHEGDCGNRYHRPRLGRARVRSRPAAVHAASRRGDGDGRCRNPARHHLDAAVEQDARSGDGRGARIGPADAAASGRRRSAPGAPGIRGARLRQCGAGASSGEYLRQGAVSADALLRCLAADAATAFSRLAADPDVDTTRLAFFGASQAGWILPLAAERARVHPRFHVILSGPAVSTGVEGYYSDLTGDGTRSPRVTDRAEVERLVLRFDGPAGFDPAPLLRASRVPTLWLLGDRDESVPTFASVRVLESIHAGGERPPHGHSLSQRQPCAAPPRRRPRFGGRPAA